MRSLGWTLWWSSTAATFSRIITIFIKLAPCWSSTIIQKKTMWMKIPIYRYMQFDHMILRFVVFLLFLKLGHRFLSNGPVHKPIRVETTRIARFGLRWGRSMQIRVLMSFLFWFQEISNRTYWTDPQTWVSNNSTNLLRGPLVRSHSIFDGLVGFFRIPFWFRFFCWYVSFGFYLNLFNLCQIYPPWN